MKNARRSSRERWTVPKKTEKRLGEEQLNAFDSLALSDVPHWLCTTVCLQSETTVHTSDIPVLKIISVLVIIKYGDNHLSISWVWVSEFISVLVSIQFFLNRFSFSISIISVWLFYHRKNDPIKWNCKLISHVVQTSQVKNAVDK